MADRFLTRHRYSRTSRKESYQGSESLVGKGEAESNAILRYHVGAPKIVLGEWFQQVLIIVFVYLMIFKPFLTSGTISKLNAAEQVVAPDHIYGALVYMIHRKSIEVAVNNPISTPSARYSISGKFVKTPTDKLK